MRLVSSEPEVPSLTEELKTLVLQEMHAVEIFKTENLVAEVEHRVRQIDLLCFRSTTKDCADAREVLAATAAIRAELERFEAAHRPVPGHSASTAVHVGSLAQSSLMQLCKCCGGYNAMLPQVASGWRRPRS
jgi:hypothetical protein